MHNLQILFVIDHGCGLITLLSFFFPEWLMLEVSGLKDESGFIVSKM